ncbi:MAG: LysR substrate-binding domain-containing protein, partial [Candidatus Methylacidiphilales bacterium]|nr:LysR substrate-binding domain-containing protein [Candidatus Methylacidiphilales bacterium]
LRTFLIVAQELNFSRAAKKLNVAQPALSRTIADLETEMGVRLLERNTHGVALTNAGTLFLDRVRHILDDTSDAVTQAQRRSRGETGTLRIGFIGTLSQWLLPRLLQAYRTQFPFVDLVLRELGPTRQRQEILAGNLDCGFIGLTAAAPDQELQSMVAAEDELVAALPETHAFAARSAIRLIELKNEAFYLTARDNAPAFNPWLITLCEKAGFQPRIARETDRAATVLNYVAAGFGVSIFPAKIALLATCGVRFLPLKGRLPKYQYQFVWPLQHSNRALMEFAKLVEQRRNV